MGCAFGLRRDHHGDLIVSFSMDDGVARRGQLIDVWRDNDCADKALSSLLAVLGTILEDVTQRAVPALCQRSIVNHDDH